MARTKAYQRKVSAKINTVNRKLRDIEKTFSIDSEQYRRYINATTAALPPDAFTLTDEGRLQINKASAADLKLGQLQTLSKLPTAHKSMQQAKQALAQNKIRAAGQESPSESDINNEARNISDEEALQELYAKGRIEERENEKGKLRYVEEAKADLKEKGNKTYTELWEIIQKGEKKHAKKEYMRQYRQQNKQRIADYQREYRARNRAEVNRKQREYRARRAADKRLERQIAERERNNPLRRRE